MMKQQHVAKIVEISSYPPPHAGWGVRIQFVRHHLAHLGHDCQVLNIGKSRTLDSPEFVGVKNGWDYLTKVWRFCQRGYLVHMHMNGQSPKGVILALLAEVVSLLWGRRCVLTFHAGADQRFFPKQNNRWMIPIWFLLFSLPKAIICNDIVVQKKISAYGIREQKIYPIPAFSRQYLDYQPVALSEELTTFLQHRQPVLVTYLLLRPSFDIPTLFSAVKELQQEWPELGLIVMGSNTTPADLDPKDVTDLVDELGLGSCLWWTGDLPHAHFLTILSHGSVYVRTYIYDGVCSSVLEALALHKPVVACENPHRPPAVLTFKTGDVSDLTAKIRQVLRHLEAEALPAQAPDIRDTVAEEAQLLVDLAVANTRPGRRPRQGDSRTGLPVKAGAGSARG